MENSAILAFATAMFTILNPIGNVAIFAGMVSDRSTADRRSVAIKSSIAVAVILVGTVWVGEMVLQFFGVEIPGLQVMAAVLCVGFLAAGPITRVLGEKGMDIVTKLMGMVLLAIAASMFAAGAKGLLPGLAG